MDKINVQAIADATKETIQQVANTEILKTRLEPTVLLIEERIVCEKEAMQNDADARKVEIERYSEEEIDIQDKIFEGAPGGFVFSWRYLTSDQGNKFIQILHSYREEHPGLNLPAMLKKKLLLLDLEHRMRRSRTDLIEFAKS